MKITDRIIRAEMKFMDENIDPAEWLILTHYGLLELQEDIGGDFMSDLSTYEGLKIATTSYDLEDGFLLK